MKLWQRLAILAVALPGGVGLGIFVHHFFGQGGVLIVGLFLGALMKARKSRVDMQRFVERRWRKREQQPTETQPGWEDWELK